MSLSKTFYPLFLLVQPWKTGNHPDMTEKLSTGKITPTQTKNRRHVIYLFIIPDEANIAKRWILKIN